MRLNRFDEELEFDEDVSFCPVCGNVKDEDEDICVECLDAESYEHTIIIDLREEV